LRRVNGEVGRASKRDIGNIRARRPAKQLHKL
jgi:hypothetical protein